jgi:protease-4
MLKTALLAGLALVMLVAAPGCINVSAFAPARLEETIVEESPRWIERNRIAVVDVEGIIGGALTAIVRSGSTSVADVKQKLMLAERDRRVKAVVLRIDSPGGEASASDMIHQEILRFRARTGKPVVAVLLGTAASGGYYVACAANQIIASPGTVTGSVGVVMHFVSAEGLLQKIGLRSEVIKSGEMKDIGTFSREMTLDERRVLQQINNSLFARFLEVVREGRPNITEDQIAAIVDGRVVTAAEAYQLNMVDGIGYPDDAIELARRLAGIESADVVMYRAYPDYNSNIYAAMLGPRFLEKGLDALVERSGPSFLYLWSPAW